MVELEEEGSRMRSLVVEEETKEEEVEEMGVVEDKEEEV